MKHKKKPKVNSIDSTRTPPNQRLFEDRSNEPIQTRYSSSRGRRRPDVNALNAIVRQHLELPSTPPFPSSSDESPHGFFPLISGPETDMSERDSNSDQYDDDPDRYLDTKRVSYLRL